MPQPIVAITTDIAERHKLPITFGYRSYTQAVREAGGLPVLLPPPEDDHQSVAGACAARFDAFVLTGGDDPRTEPFGVPTHPKAIPLHPDRQAFESALIAALDADTSKPVLGVCLGMQLMALHAGGTLDQYMPETTPTHADHELQHHCVRSSDQAQLPSGTVWSRHKQAVTDAGALRVLARAHDGVIEAVHDPARPFWLGVQWHPERSPDAPLGLDLFRRLVAAVTR